MESEETFKSNTLRCECVRRCSTLWSGGDSRVIFDTVVHINKENVTLCRHCLGNSSPPLYMLRNWCFLCMCHADHPRHGILVGGESNVSVHFRTYHTVLSDCYDTQLPKHSIKCLSHPLRTYDWRNCQSRRHLAWAPPSSVAVGWVLISTCVECCGQQPVEGKHCSLKKIRAQLYMWGRKCLFLGLLMVVLACKKDFVFVSTLNWTIQSKHNN